MKGQGRAGQGRAGKKKKKGQTKRKEINKKETNVNNEEEGVVRTERRRRRRGVWGGYLRVPPPCGRSTDGRIHFRFKMVPRKGILV